MWFCGFYVYVVTEYLKGDKWKVHPDWVYCEYNSLHDLERERENSGELFSRDMDDISFESPEQQLLHFLARAGRPGWKWMSVSDGTCKIVSVRGFVAYHKTYSHMYWCTHLLGPITIATIPPP